MLGSQAYPQQATLWTGSAMDGYGKRAYTAPQLIMIRWQQELKLALTKDGEEITQIGQVWLQDSVNVGDYLALGNYTESSDAGAVADPTTLSNAYIVFDYQEQSSVMATDVNRKALMRAK